MAKGQLVLETGEIFTGDWIGYMEEGVGELVFNTSMTGYQEMLTDPSYAGQIVTLTYPVVGNYGMNVNDSESYRLQVAGVILNDVCDEPSHYLLQTTFTEALKKHAIPGLKNVDTRALVALIRKYGTVKGRLVLEKVFPDYKHEFTVPSVKELIQEVAVKSPTQMGEGNYHIVLLDFGYKKSIVTALLDLGCQVTVVPYHYTVKAIKALQPDGIMISNGPGNPSELQIYFPHIKAMTEAYPTLGICLGHQLIALAHGAETEKLPFGHRGSNHPIKDVQTGKISMTAQNHGYVVKKESVSSDVFQVIYEHVHDQSVEGMKHKHLPITTVQFHPEAHPGPSDTAHILSDFVQQVKLLKEECLWGKV
ncbi:MULTISPECIES: carbamoyl phosphate synthase small subunit [Clostridia]|uniref:carbamoyl phosphate synthase small subunit n=1 Tax=Clostridia TaxID=186801 RepID=UPI000EA31A6A|nr:MULTISPECIES: carbamoyl phosphate synthase small subunit [Clostridia]NBJ69077.1 carbamoyl phosphate synthase small subunit [Roseburia sp. 1XD42-34]RKI79503.1 carbamoyl phosphate synthase small subunit [Clostridium sp. 1xD42-85]